MIFIDSDNEQIALAKNLGIHGIEIIQGNILMHVEIKKILS